VTRETTIRVEQERALEALAPERFGFRPYQSGWIREFTGIGDVAFAPLGWHHAQSPSYNVVNGERVPITVLELIVLLQERVWGFPPELTVPTNVLAIIPDGGGQTIIAYDLAKGCNADGWLGFLISLGGRSGTLVSHMLGIREDMRGSLDLGWFLKVLQAYDAVRTGHHAVSWTFDPMRGANARLNLEKLRATVEEYTIDKYGPLTSALYGDVPSDRFTARWDLLSPEVHERLRLVYEGQYRPMSLEDVADIPEVTTDSCAELLAAAPPRLRYRIPGDIDALMRSDQGTAIRWRQELRAVIGALVTTKSARDVDTDQGPIAARVEARPGRYAITEFATGLDAAGERQSYYVLERKQGEEKDHS